MRPTLTGELCYVTYLHSIRLLGPRWSVSSNITDIVLSHVLLPLTLRLYTVPSMSGR